MDAETRARLDEAYRATTYRAGRLELRVGEPSPVLDLILRARGLDAWAYLTAANPGSRALTEADNAPRMRALEAAVRERGLTYLKGEAVADAGDWPPEPSLLVLGLSREDSLALGRAYGQNAVLVGAAGGIADLAWVE